MDLPFLTSDLPGIAGCIKASPSTFVVEEIPAYLPCGEGEHLFLWIEKADLSAEQLLMHLARTLGIERREIGMAGLKDRRAVTRQWVSVPIGCETRLADVESDQVRVLESGRHRNKLKTGHLRGNRFTITVEGTVDGDLERAEQIRDRLLAQGTANYYGEQRFGREDETLRLGLALLRGESREREIPFARRKFLTRLAISAAQSWLFNLVLAERLRDGLAGTALSGDVLQVCASGGLFVCEEPAVDQSRCDRHEVAVTGPMFGAKMKQPALEPFAREQKVLITSGITGEMWDSWKHLAPGARRSFVVHLAELSLMRRAPDAIELSFALPSGAYATSVLREFVRTEVDAGAEDRSS